MQDSQRYKSRTLQILMAEISDDRILNLLKSKHTSERGFRLLMEKYSERVYWHVRRMVSVHEDANDVVQNCFIKVFRSIHRFEGKSSLYTWLYRIATNESITFLNKRKKRQMGALDDVDNQVYHQLRADSYFDGNEAEVLLHTAIATLPEKQKAVFMLRYFEEMSYKEMSEVMETSVGGLKASFHHAVKKIEAKLSSNATHQ